MLYWWLIADGTITLSKEDIASLSAEETLSSPKDAKSPTTRIVRGNEASEYALQINTPIGVDVWKDIGSVVVENNEAVNASQFNYPIESVDVAAMEMRKAQLSSKDEN